MKIRSAWRKLASAIFGMMLLFTWGASANEPRNIVPGTPDSLDFFYVFGPSGSPSAGRKDTNQTVWVRVPDSATGDLTIYVQDPGSGSRYEQKSGFWTSCTTEFSVFGGTGAATSLTATGGELLEHRSYGKDAALRDQWVAFGPYPLSKGEAHNGFRWFKFSADGVKGSGVNFFKLGVSSAQAEFLTYDLHFHTGGERGRQVNFGVEMPTQGTEVTEVNYDYDNGNIPFLNGQALKASSSGSSTTNKVNLGSNAGNRMNYVVEKGSQDYANGAVWFRDGQGKPLYIFLTPALNRPAPAVGNCQTTRTSLVTLTKCLPPQVVLGQEYSAILTVTASQEVGNVVVTDMLGDGATVVRTEPAAQKTGSNLVWKVDRMAAGESRTFEVVLTPGREGEIGNCATISAEPVACLTVSVGKPVLAITKTGPAQALINSQVPYSITVTNTGTAPATDVVVRDSIPAGLSHASGDKTVVVNVGTLNPGESRTMPISLKADARGRHCNVAQATSSNAAEVRAEACTLVVQQGLAVAKTGTKEQFANKVADYEITVTNTGDTSLTNVVVTDTPPTGTKVLKTQPAGNETRGTVVWTIAELKAGEKQTFAVSLTSPVAGNLCNQVGASSAEGVSAQAEACTLWKGHPALLIEVVDTVDPLLPGESTTYIIQVKNQGTAPDHNVGITVRFPPSISPTAVSGVTAGKIDGKVVTFPPVTQLEPKQVVEWRVEAKADVTAGDSRLKVEMRSDLLKTPVVEEESTHVY